MRYTALRLLSLTIFGIVCAVGAAKQDVNSIRETITDNSIVPPESFETDTKALLDNWYLRNYTVLDEGIAPASTGAVSDEEYIRRLSAMPTEIEMPFNSVVKSYIEMYTERRQSLVESMLGLSLYYMPIFEQALEKEGLPLELKYLPVIESALNPVAVSRVGAAGLWQFMVSTAKGVGLEVNTLVDERRDPYRSSEKAAVYLKSLYNIYKDWSLAIAAYNCGPGKVNQALRRAGGESKDFWQIYPYLPKETRGYVPAFIAANYVMTYYKSHGISPRLAKKPLLTDLVDVNSRINLAQVSEVLNIPIDQLRVLNPQYRKDVIPGNIHTYQLCLPLHQVGSFIMSEDSIVTFNQSKYARRTVAEPAVIGEDNNVTGVEGVDWKYETKEVVKRHTVKRKETMNSIARKYGVTTASIREANGLSRNTVRRGQVLKIVTTQREKVLIDKDAEEVEEPEEIIADEEVEESTAAESEDTDESEANDEDQDAEPEVVRATVATSPTKRSSDDVVMVHTVKAGETLYSIAKDNGITVAELMAANNMTQESDLKAGNSVVIPEKGAVKVAPAKEVPAKVATTEVKKERPSKDVRHRVKSGDSLQKIAEEYCVTIDEIKLVNNLPSDVIQRGQVLTIPSAATVAKKRAEAKKAESAKVEKETKQETSAPEGVEYTVRKGDSLGKIANLHGVEVDAVMAANGLKNYSIMPGQKLIIPGGKKVAAEPKTKKQTTTTHRVRSGETLSEIADRYGVTVRAIKRANSMSSDRLSIGQRLKIPTR